MVGSVLSKERNDHTKVKRTKLIICEHGDSLLKTLPTRKSAERTDECSKLKPAGNKSTDERATCRSMHRTTR